MRLVVLISIFSSFIANAKGFDNCSNYYDFNGKLIKEADINNCKYIRFFVKTKTSLYREFKLNAPDEEDRYLLSSPPIKIEIITLADIKNATKNVPENTILDIVSLLYAASESWDALDFASSLPRNSLIGDTLYGSSNDSGNFLWGYSMAKMGVPLITSKIGAEFNAIVIDDAHSWDGVGDRRAINKGYIFFVKNMSNSQILKKYLDLIIL